MQTEDADVRQIVIRFGASGYIVRYAIISETADILRHAAFGMDAKRGFDRRHPKTQSPLFENALTRWPGLVGRRAGWCAQSSAVRRAVRSSGPDGSPRRALPRLRSLA